MDTMERHQIENETQEKEFFEELDKGIDSMEAGRVVPHEEAMRIIRERVND